MIHPRNLRNILGAEYPFPEPHPLPQELEKR